MKVSEFLIHAIEASGKSQKTIATESGFEKPNIITMLKQGKTRVPLARIPAIALAVGVAPKVLMDMCLQEYDPDLYDTLQKVYSI